MELEKHYNIYSNTSLIYIINDSFQGQLQDL